MRVKNTPAAVPLLSITFSCKQFFRKGITQNKITHLKCFFLLLKDVYSRHENDTLAICSSFRRNSVSRKCIRCCREDVYTEIKNWPWFDKICDNSSGREKDWKRSTWEVFHSFLSLASPILPRYPTATF